MTGVIINRYEGKIDATSKYQFTGLFGTIGYEIDLSRRGKFKIVPSAGIGPQFYKQFENKEKYDSQTNFIQVRYKLLVDSKLHKNLYLSGGYQYSHKPILAKKKDMNASEWTVGLCYYVKNKSVLR